MSQPPITTVSPSSNLPISTRQTLSDEQLSVIVRKSSDAFINFRSVGLAQRKEIVQRALAIFIAEKQKLASELTEYLGRPIIFAGKEIDTAVSRAEYLLEICSDVLTDTLGDPEPGFRRFIQKVPVGPTLIIFAWNYPYLILFNSAIPAILAGNSIILKPSPQTPTIAENFQRIFSQAGAPIDVVQYFHSGDFNQVERVIKNPAIKLVCFTGSITGGLRVKSAATERIDLRTVLELGGKDPAYVRPDVDLDWVADNIVDGAVFNSGQSCCSLERIYVHESIHDSFVAALQKVLKNYKLGNPSDPSTNVGPVISKDAQSRIRAHIQEALNLGARDVTPPNETFATAPTQGNFVAPVILVNVSHEMKIMREETFGPVIPVMGVRHDFEAVRLMNDSEYGLTASVWTKDIREGQKIAESLEAGTVFINRCDYPSPDLAWTGWKNSGQGHTLSRFGFDQFLKLKSNHFKEAQ